MTGIRSLSTVVGIVLTAPLAAAQTPSVTSSTSAPPAAAAPAATTDSVTWVILSSKQGELRGKLPQAIAAEIDKAQASGLTPFLEVGATWCSPCLALEASLHNKEIIDAFTRAYVIHLDVNEWDVVDEMGPLGIDGGQMPILAAINPKGHVIAQLKGAGGAESIKKFVQGHLWPAANKHVAQN